MAVSLANIIDTSCSLCRMEYLLEELAAGNEDVPLIGLNGPGYLVYLVRGSALL